MEKKMVDQVIEKLDFSIHDLTSTLFDAMHITQSIDIDGTTKKRVVLAVIARLITQIKDDDEIARANIIAATFPALIDMAIAMGKEFNRTRCFGFLC